MIALITWDVSRWRPRLYRPFGVFLAFIVAIPLLQRLERRYPWWRTHHTRETWGVITAKDLSTR